MPCRNQIQHLGFELRYTLKVQHGPRKLDSVQKEFPFLGGGFSGCILTLKGVCLVRCFLHLFSSSESLVLMVSLVREFAVVKHGAASQAKMACSIHISQCHTIDQQSLSYTCALHLKHVAEKNSTGSC